jgi:thiamine biosynthesis lipoprotein
MPHAVKSMHTAAVIMSFLISGGIGPTQRFEYSQLHMGVRVRVVLYATGEDHAERAASSAFAVFAELDALLSDYRRDSELNRLCDRAGSGAVEVSEHLFRVLERAKEVARRTAGAFDPTAGPLVRLWRKTLQTGAPPNPEALANARALVGWHLMLLDPKRRTVELLNAGMRLDLGGIAKGYACDQALEALRQEGVSSALVEAGGDLALGDPPPGGRGWVVSVPHAGKRIALSRCGVSTSGNDVQFIEIAGVRYSHILDPRTGYGLTVNRTITVIGPDAFTTDPIATALCVLGERAVPMVEAWANVRAIPSNGT